MINHAWDLLPRPLVSELLALVKRDWTSILPVDKCSYDIKLNREALAAAPMVQAVLDASPSRPRT
jgi:hypothetical protein